MRGGEPHRPASSASVAALLPARSAKRRRLSAPAVRFNIVSGSVVGPCHAYSGSWVGRCRMPACVPRRRYPLPQFATDASSARMTGDSFGTATTLVELLRGDHDAQYIVAIHW